MPRPDLLCPPRPEGPLLAIVLTGGGARAAYQVGFLRCLARRMPEARFPIVTGVSAGAINAAYLAARRGTFAEAAEGLTELWSGLTPGRIFRVDSFSLGRTLVRWGLRLLSGGGPVAPRVRGLLDTTPLHALLEGALGPSDHEIPGIRENLEAGRLTAFALSTLRFSTGQNVTWVQGCGLEAWERPNRVGIEALLSVDHVMASAALPLLFPAVQLGGAWYGDGGVRMTAPLAPAVHLGADRVLAISTRYRRTTEEASVPVVRGYPPPAQVAGAMINALFLDSLDQDALRMERINSLLRRLAPEQRDGLRVVDTLVLHPSQDLGRLVSEFEPRLPKTFRFLTRGLGTRETASPDILSLLMFQPDYLQRLIEIGEQDAERRLGEIGELMLGG